MKVKRGILGVLGERRESLGETEKGGKKGREKLFHMDPFSIPCGIKIFNKHIILKPHESKEELALPNLLC